MLKIKANDGETFEGQTWEDIIEAMRIAVPLVPDPDLVTFMKGVQRRAKVWNGSEVRIDDYETFIRDLAAGGLIEILEDESK